MHNDYSRIWVVFLRTQETSIKVFRRSLHNLDYALLFALSSTFRLALGDEDQLSILTVLDLVIVDTGSVQLMLQFSRNEEKTHR